MPGRALELAVYIMEAAQRQWLWRDWNCTIFAGEWVERVTGCDVLAPWRGAYSSEAEAEALIRCLGGMRGAVDLALRPIGAKRVARPSTGDVGVVLAPDRRETAAVRGEQGWWLVAPGAGVALASFRCLAAWEVPCRR